MADHKGPIRVGLCAFGMSGKVFHAPFLDCMPEFEFSAVVERHEKKATVRYPAVRSYDSVDELLEDDSLEVIVVNTPNVTHYAYVKAALEAGRHVVVEKPFTATSAQAVELMALARERQRMLTVFQNRRWDGDFLTVKEVLAEKLLGTLIEAEIHYDRYRLGLNEIKKHKEIPDPGVGNIFDLGPHLIDQALVLFGKPDSVFALVQRHRPQSKVDDYFDIKLLYDAFTCTLKSSMLVREPGPGYIVHGTLGSFVKRWVDVQEPALVGGASPCQPGWGAEAEADWGILNTTVDGIDVRKTYPSVAGDYPAFFRGLYQALRKGGEPPVKLEDSLLNMRIIEAALESERSKAAVAL